MRERKHLSTDNCIAVDIEGLQAMLSVGRCTAANIGNLAGASIKIGRRRLYNVQKIKDYLNHTTMKEV